MAILHPSTGTVVLRIVYDGAPEAGKTTSVRSLGRDMERDVFTPEQPGERTIFFDWLDYTGGLFEGSKIRCQIVAVPGQELLRARRRELVVSADVVVLVAHATSETVGALMQQIRHLRELLAEAASPPAGILLQLNKRDAPDAVPIEVLRAALDAENLDVAIVESVATSGLGIRKAFVFSVRLGLDRVRALRDAGRLESTDAIVSNGDDLLKQLLESEAMRAASTTSDDGQKVVPIAEALDAFLEHESDTLPSAGQRTRVDNDVDIHPHVPALPSANVASGMIWPPISGRMYLSEALDPGPELSPTSNGWLGVVGGKWRIHSATEHRFDTLEAARSELLDWARLHSTLQRVLSSPRCVCIAETGQRDWRLWQLVRVRNSLRDDVAGSLHVDDPVRVVETLVRMGRRLVEFERTRSEHRHGLTCSLDTVGDEQGFVRFVGFVPTPERVRKAAVQPRDLIVAQVLRPILADWAHRKESLLDAMADHRYRRVSDANREVLSQLELLFRDL